MDILKTALGRSILTFLLLLSATITWAQAPKHTRWAEVRERDSLKLDNLVRNAPVVFEGIRISGEPMSKIRNGYRYSSAIVRVGHVYRGSNLKPGQLVEVQRNEGYQTGRYRHSSHWKPDPDKDTLKAGGYGSEYNMSVYFCENAQIKPFHDYSQKNEVSAFETFEKQGASTGIQGPNAFGLTDFTWRGISIFRTWFYLFPNVIKYVETENKQASSPKKSVGGSISSGNVQNVVPPSIDSIRSVRSVRLKQPKLNIRAGFNDTLLIYGKNFTNTMNIGFFNALYDTDYIALDSANQRYYNSFKYFTIDPSDYIAGRTTSLIKVVVPSFSSWFIRTKQNGLQDNGCAGSGKIRLYSDSLKRFRQVDTFLVESAEALHIEYSRINDINNSGVKVPYISAARGCQPQYPVVLNSNIPSNWQPYIKKAFREWNKALGMPIFVIENATTTDTLVSGKLVVHKINYANFGLMSTEYDGTIPTANDLATARFGGRISIGTVKRRLTLPPFTTTWVLDSTFTQGITTATSRDFYSDMLHEIGHFLNLDHSTDSTLAPLQELMYFKDIAPITAAERVSLTTGGAQSLKGAKDCILSSSTIPLTNDTGLRSYGEWLAQPSKINHCTGATTKTVTVINAKAGSIFLWEYSHDGGLTWQACSGSPGLYTNSSTAILGVKKSINLPNGAQVRCKTSLSGCTIPSNPIEIVNAGTAGILPLSNVKCTDAPFTLNYGLPKGGQYVIAPGSNCPNCIQNKDLFVPANIAPATTKVFINYVIPSPCTAGVNVTSENHELNTLCTNADYNFKQLRINGLYRAPQGGNINDFPCTIPGTSQFYVSVSATAAPPYPYPADTFKIQLSDANGFFPTSLNSRIIGKYYLPAAAMKFDKSILCTFPSYITAGSGYRIQVINNSGNYYAGNQFRYLPAITISSNDPMAACYISDTPKGLTAVQGDDEAVPETIVEIGLIVDMNAAPVSADSDNVPKASANPQAIAQTIQSISIYPNPNKTNQLTVVFPSYMLTTPIQINVTDVQGKLISVLTQNTPEQIHEMELPSGVYILSAKANNQLFVQKLVVLK